MGGVHVGCWGGEVLSPIPLCRNGSSHEALAFIMIGGA